MLASRFTIINPYNGETVVLNDTTTDPNNFYGIEETPLSEVDVRNEETPLEGRHGIRSNFTFYGGRSMAFRGKILAEDAATAEEMVYKLKRVFSLPAFPSSTDNGELLVKWTDANGLNWQINVKIISDIIIKEYLGGSRLKDYFVQVRASSPMIVSQETFDEDLSRYILNLGFIVPMIVPAVMVSTHANTTFEVDGTYETAPILTIYGPVVNPRVYHVELGKTIGLDVTIADGDYVIIDIEDGTVLYNGITDYSQYLTLTSEWFYLLPGTNNIQFSHSGPTPEEIGYATTEHLTIEWRNTQV